MARRLQLSGELLLAVGIAAFGLFLAIETSAIEVSPGYARIGPRVFPWVVSGALMLLGLWLVRDAWTRRWVSEESMEGAPEFHWQAFVLIGLGLLLDILLIGRAGFIIASAILFACVARGFGSRHLLRDTAIGLILSLIVFIGFTRGLDLDLPAGVLEGIL
jgi:putative tricarboxylic transport membrane protein